MPVASAGTESWSCGGHSSWIRSW